ncbi:hypothetical protein [Nocardia carnea]|uniref:Uncharacterized protein n=1 Tax=Nocardia carnea TaxID=37328 RepID=A0ABW7TFD2_9NOCA|nr:hypothetical protein [Nocardia carnea]
MGPDPPSTGVDQFLAASVVDRPSADIEILGDPSDRTAGRDEVNDLAAKAPADPGVHQLVN